MYSALRTIGPPDPNDIHGDPNGDEIDRMQHGLTPDEIDALFGVEHPEMDTTTETAPHQGRGSRFLQSFAGLESQPQHEPSGFLSGLVGGVSSGLGSAGTRAQASRAKLEAGIATRQAKRDAGNQQATAAYRAAHSGAQKAYGTAMLGESLADRRAAASASRETTRRTDERTAKNADTIASETRSNAEWTRRNNIEAGQKAATAKGAATTKPPTPDQLKASAFYGSAKDALDAIHPKGHTADSVEERIARLPTNEQYGLRAPNWMQSDDMQVYNASKLAFATAVLRRESGAAISQSEFQGIDKQFFVQPGDSRVTIDRKRKARQIKVDGLLTQSGPQTNTAGDDADYQEYLLQSGGQ